jgi:hypothetical protein
VELNSEATPAWTHNVMQRYSERGGKTSSITNFSPRWTSFHYSFASPVENNIGTKSMGFGVGFEADLGVITRRKISADAGNRNLVFQRVVGNLTG